MKKIFCYLILFLFLSLPCLSNEIISTINSENLYLTDFNRLYNAQKRRFQKEFNLNLYGELDPKVISKRKEFLLKAKIEGVDIKDEGTNQLLAQTPDDLKQRHKENLILEKYFEKHARHKVLELMINERLALQTAKERKINIAESDITKKINAIKEKEGGEEGFLKFLESNNATIDDAKKEIKNKLTYDHVKASFTDEDAWTSFLHDVKLNADIVVYYNKIFEDEVSSKHEETVLRAPSREPTKEDIAKSLGLIQEKLNSVNPNLTVTVHTTPNKDEIIKSLGLIPQDPELINPNLTITLNYKKEVIIPEETNFLSHLKSLFRRKEKTSLNEFPLLTPEQQSLLDEQIRLREEITTEEENIENNNLRKRIEVK